MNKKERKYVQTHLRLNSMCHCHNPEPPTPVRMTSVGKKTQKQHSQCDDMQRVLKKKKKIKLHKEIVLSFLPGSFLRLSNMF